MGSWRAQRSDTQSMKSLVSRWPLKSSISILQDKDYQDNMKFILTFLTNDYVPPLKTGSCCKIYLPVTLNLPWESSIGDHKEQSTQANVRLFWKGSSGDSSKGKQLLGGMFYITYDKTLYHWNYPLKRSNDERALRPVAGNDHWDMGKGTWEKQPKRPTNNPFFPSPRPSWQQPYTVEVT